MTKATNIFIVGGMGVGKTTLGRQLSKELHLDFYDSDQEIIAKTGADIPWIFDLEGEEGFRKREEQAIAALTAKNGIVLATGGGAVIKAENRQALRANGVVIYLTASVDSLLERTAKSKNRPLLANDNRRQILEQLLIKRDPLYREVADLVYDTDDYTTQRLVSRIKRDLKKLCNT